MSEASFFRVAGLPFSVTLPTGDASGLLPSFRPFGCAPGAAGEPAFHLRLTMGSPPPAPPGELLAESVNDMGHLRLFRHSGAYRVEMGYGDGVVHAMAVDPQFDSAEAFMPPGSPSAGIALSSMLRVLFAQSLLLHSGVSLHASCVVLCGRAYLFLGKSGTGKSTHARLWAETFPGCRLLNDDNPVLRFSPDGKLLACGTPWSGKTPCYLDECHPVAGIVRLRQAGTNRFTPLADEEAFAALLPSCSSLRADPRLQEALFTTLIRVAGQVPVGLMDCRPDAAAARLCLEGLKTNNKPQS